VIDAVCRRYKRGNNKDGKKKRKKGDSDEEDEVEPVDNFNDEDGPIELDVSDSEAPPAKRARVSASSAKDDAPARRPAQPKSASAKSAANSAPKPTAKRKRQSEESDDVSDEVLPKRPRREAQPASAPSTNGHEKEIDAPAPKVRASDRVREAAAATLTAASKSNGTALALSQSSGDRDLQTLISKLQVICARLGGKDYQNLTLSKLKLLNEVSALAPFS
jgi:hypothetical protein